MKYVIYIDVFFCVNLVMDFLILKLLSLYIKPQTTYTRCLLGAIVGSLLSALSLLIGYEHFILHMLFSYLFIAVAMILVTYGMEKYKIIIKRCIILYIVTIFLGGLINFLYSCTYVGVLVQNIMRGMRSANNVMWLLGTTIVSYVCLLLLVRIFRRYGKTSTKVQVCLVLGTKSKQLVGLIDSGNNLREPYTCKPVHVACIESVSELLEGIDIYAIKFKLVPFTSLGKKHGLLKVITFDELLVYDNDKISENSKDAIYIEQEVSIGLYEGSLSNSDEFHILLHKCVGL